MREFFTKMVDGVTNCRQTNGDLHDQITKKIQANNKRIEHLQHAKFHTKQQIWLVNARIKDSVAEVESTNKDLRIATMTGQCLFSNKCSDMEAKIKHLTSTRGIKYPSHLSAPVLPMHHNPENGHNIPFLQSQLKVLQNAINELPKLKRQNAILRRTLANIEYGECPPAHTTVNSLQP